MTTQKIPQMCFNFRILSYWKNKIRLPPGFWRYIQIQMFLMKGNFFSNAPRILTWFSETKNIILRKCLRFGILMLEVLDVFWNVPLKHSGKFLTIISAMTSNNEIYACVNFSLEPLQTKYTCHFFKTIFHVYPVLYILGFLIHVCLCSLETLKN